MSLEHEESILCGRENCKTDATSLAQVEDRPISIANELFNMYLLKVFYLQVVDARAGPGMKCMSKFKKKRNEMYRSEKRIKEEGEAGSMSEESWSDDDGASDEEVVVRARRKPAMPVRNLNANAMSDVGFLDSTIWKMYVLFIAFNIYEIYLIF